MTWESESETRARRINPILDGLGWRRKSGHSSGPHCVEEYETDNGPADYALCVDNRVLGVIEANRLTLGPQNALTQAERYARGATQNPFNFAGLHVPFLYSTNGEVIWFHDVRHRLNASWHVACFHSPAAFTEMLDRDFDGACRKLQAYRQMKAGVAKRVLFLVDRRALAAQAVRAFKSFEPEPALKFDQIYELYSQAFKREDFDEDEKFDPTVLPAKYLLDPQPGHTFVYVCTIQRMAMNLFGHQAGTSFGEIESGDEDANQLDIPIHAFDLIIADECHRGYTSQELSVWRDTLNPRILIQSIVRCMKPDPRVRKDFTIGDTIYEAPSTDRFDVILTNPPFGTKGANQAPNRDDFTIQTSNKQLNFVQHILTVLQPGGRAAVVLPDNCLFADQAGEVFKILCEDCDLHTVLRLPRGTFTPYSQGVKANVVFFTKGYPTEQVWIYDARSNVPGITKKDRPLSPEHFAEFERCFGPDPNGKAKRKEKDSPPEKGYLGGDRWRRFSLAEVQARDFKLNSFKWLKDESLEDADELPPPEELATDAISELETAVEELNAALTLLENGNGLPGAQSEGSQP